MTKYFGDIPPDHLELLRELQDLEAWFKDSNGIEIPPLTAAKGFVAMAYDYYSMYFSEEGYRLLETADILYPGYFMGPITEHAKNDKDFRTLFNILKKTPESLEVMRLLGLNE